MSYEGRNRSKESRFGSSDESVSEAAGERKPGVYQSSSTGRELQYSSFPERDAVDCNEPKVTRRKQCVLARRGWLHEKLRLFGILLTREDPFKVIPKREDHDAH
jgi:hypothetical protein